MKGDERRILHASGGSLVPNRLAGCGMPPGCRATSIRYGRCRLRSGC